MSRQRIKRLIPSIEPGASKRHVCVYWPKGAKHPDLAIAAFWIGWGRSKGNRRPQRPRNISGVEGGHYWHWSLGLGFIDWWGQRLYR